MKTIFLSHSTKDEILAKSIYTLITQFIESSERLAGQYEVFIHHIVFNNLSMGPIIGKTVYTRQCRIVNVAFFY